MKLRSYQADSVRDIFKSWKKHTSVLYVLSTGGGKTVVAARIIQQLIYSGKRILFVAHRRELVNQAVAKLVADGINELSIGVIMSDDVRIRPSAPIQVASIDTLRHRRKPKADIVVIDEAHRAVAPTYRKLSSWYPDVPTLGLTATPERLDGSGLGGVFQDIVLGAKMSELIAGEWLMRPRVFTKPGSIPLSLKGIKTVRGDYDIRQLGRRMNRKELIGDIVGHWISHAFNRRTICFAVNIEHSKSITKAFLKAGVKAAHIDGETPVKRRAMLLEQLASGKIRVLSNCNVLTEGLDIPPVKGIIQARATKSLTVYLQQTGRSERPYKEKLGRFKDQQITPIILDHSGNAYVHGLPDEDRDWHLFVGRRKGKKGPAPAKSCESCGLVVHAGVMVCPDCGFEFPKPVRYVQAAGQLREVNPPNPEILRKDYAKILQFAARKSFPQKWARDVFQMKYGYQPESVPA